VDSVRSQKTATKKHLEKRFGVRNGDSRIEIQLVEKNDPDL